MTARTDGAHVEVPVWHRNTTAAFDCSQALRRLAHRAKREALDWQAKNHTTNYRYWRLESDQLWRRAKWYLQFARSLSQDRIIS